MTSSIIFQCFIVYTQHYRKIGHFVGGHNNHNIIRVFVNQNR